MYKIRYCAEWVDPKLGWVVAQSFHPDPEPALVTRTVNGRRLILSPDIHLVEIPDECKELSLHWNIRSLIHVDPDDLCKELVGFHWDKILDLSDGYWNIGTGRGVLHPESNMGLPEDTAIGFNRADKTKFISDLRRRGSLIAHITGKKTPRFSTLQPKELNTRAYFAGRDMADVIARIQIHKVMES